MIIGLTGPQRAGKTTVMEYLQQRHGFHPMSVAAQIKDESHRYVNTTFPDHLKDTPQPILSGKTPRDLYIHVGNLDEYVHHLWVERMFRRQYQGPDEVHVIESVGKQFQWTEIVRYCERTRDAAVILDVSRPDHTYKDSRSPIRDVFPILRMENDGDLDALKANLDGFVYGLSNLRHVRTLAHVLDLEKIEQGTVQFHPV